MLKRAIRTLNIALDEMDQMWLPVERTWRLNERHYGALQGLDKAQTVARHGSRPGENLASQLRHPATAAAVDRSWPSALRSAVCRRASRGVASRGVT